MSSAHAKSDRDEPRSFLTGLARGLAGALLFALPMLMTMEMWDLGLSVDRGRLLLLAVLNIPLLAVLARRLGFEKTTCWSEAVRDAAIAYGLGIVMSTAILLLLGVLHEQLTLSNAVAKVALQSVPASIGALLGRSQLGMHSDEKEEDGEESAGVSGYLHELFMMAVGALFLNLNVAPTEEMVLIAYRITPVQTLCLTFLSLAVMHGFVYALHFRGTHRLARGTPAWHGLVRFTLPGYVIALAVSLYTLWTFGQLDHTSTAQIVTATVILGFPATVGAAAARLIL